MSDHAVNLSAEGNKLFPCCNCGWCYTGNKMFIICIESAEKRNLDQEFASCTVGRRRNARQGTNGVKTI
jgi:hypothetical protein